MVYRIPGESNTGTGLQSPMTIIFKKQKQTEHMQQPQYIHNFINVVF